MADQLQLDKALSELARVLIAEGDLRSTLERVAGIACSSVSGCDYAGVTLVERDRVKSVACTDPVVEEVDRAQYETGDGPCVQTVRDGRMHRSGDLLGDPRWPRFSEVAERHGISSVLAVPLQVGDRTAAALNLYGTARDAFDERDGEVAALLAAHASAVVANANAYEDALNRAANLEKALESRGVIERAKGILMAREGCDEDQAFAMLVAASQRLNIKLREIAKRVVQQAQPASGAKERNPH